MKPIIYILLMGLFFTSCSHRIVRTGYQAKKSAYKNCDVIITRETEISDTIAIKIGEIKLGESGFSVACSEEHAVKILKNEACAINADLIIITEENRPDLWSSCYRCRADFYQYKNPNTKIITHDDDAYATQQVKERVSNDRSKNTVVFMGAVMVGVLLGLFLL